MNERNYELVRRYEAGASASELARDYGITRQRVYQLLEREGVRSRDTLEAKRDRARSAAEAIVETGAALTLTEAAREYQTTVRAIRPQLENLGFDYVQARTYYRLGLHEARAGGEGETTCTKCGEVKAWAEMAKSKTTSGASTRRRRCKSCASAESMDTYYDRKRTK